MREAGKRYTQTTHQSQKHATARRTPSIPIYTWLPVHWRPRRMPASAHTIHPKPGICLSKWYLDLVTDEGEAVVLYWARMQYRGFGGTFASLLHRDPSGRIRTSSSLRAGDEPSAASQIAWACPGLGVESSWTPVVPAITQEPWRTPEGGASWNCIAPAATASLTLNGRELQGVGHVERLDLTVRPWMLPIRELRWGRWISDAVSSTSQTPVCDRETPAKSIVWIKWSGDHPLTLIAHDGQLVQGEVHESSVTLESGLALPLSHDATLREGAIGITALSFIPGISRLLPPALLATHEHKWLCRAAIGQRHGDTSQPSIPSGWAIHERVRFGELDRACDTLSDEKA